MTSRYKELFLPEQREEVVKKVVSLLKSQGKLSNKSINNFRDILKDGKPIPGFNKDPIRALPHMLEQNILERMEQIPSFEDIVAGFWAEAQRELRDAVSERLDELDPKVFADDEMADDFWDAQVNLIAAKCNDYAEDDILLMLNLCRRLFKAQAKLSSVEAGNGGAPEKTPNSAVETASDFLSDAMKHLKMIPADSAAWSEEIPRFAQALNDLMDAKAEERGRLNKLLEEFDGFQNEFASELEFFGRGADDWNLDHLAAVADISEAARLLAELKSTLIAYHAISERADTIAEERERRARRHELEDDIEQMLTEIDALPQAAVADPEPASDAAVEAPAQPQLEEVAQLRRNLIAAQGERDDFQKRSEELQAETEGLNDDKQALTDEVAELKDQLRISEGRELSWRSAYETAVSSSDSSDPAPILSNIESVRQAIDLAETRYGDKLAFHLNKKSDRDYNYKRPKEVWDALEWLATIYHPTQTGGSRVKDLNESIRNTCSGWEYKANQKDITFNMYREWYTATKDGKPYELRKHLSKGSGRDRNVIRIAFEWDEETDTVLVGYIGPHQRSRAT